MTVTAAIPATYAEWSACLDLFEQGLNDEAALAAMEQGRLSWSSGVAELFSERISDTVSKRLQRTADQMSRQFASGNDEVVLVRALIGARNALVMLLRLANVPAFPEMLRDHLKGELQKYAERAQKSLEDTAKTDRSGRTASLIRNNSLLAYATCAMPAPMPAPAASAASNTPGNTPSPNPRRRNILV